jgi:hypothetical protein
LAGDEYFACGAGVVSCSSVELVEAGAPVDYLGAPASERYVVAVIAVGEVTGGTSACLVVAVWAAVDVLVGRIGDGASCSGFEVTNLVGCATVG